VAKFTTIKSRFHRKKTKNITPTSISEINSEASQIMMKKYPLKIGNLNKATNFAKIEYVNSHIKTKKIMEREIKFSLVYRDMFQSSGKFQPLAEQLKKIAPVIVEMGCFARVETNGGAFEQVNLMAGENPNKAVREFTKTFNDAGIQTHMLDRALNALRMFPVPADVRRLMYKVKKAQGVDITRIF
jgi:pyruvate carboxylase